MSVFRLKILRLHQLTCQLQDWPPMFGFIKDVTTLREFWGRYWHQTIRKVSRKVMLHRGNAIICIRILTNPLRCSLLTRVPLSMQ